MTDSGYVDWRRLQHSWAGVAGPGYGTFVYAFWLADLYHRERELGLAILKDEGAHPDWFIHTDNAESVIFSVGSDDWAISPNAAEVYDDHMTSRPVLASLCLGSSAAVHSRDGQFWWCSYDDLTREGKKLIRQLSRLYLRPPVILTYLNIAPMSPLAPGASRDSATVTEAPGPSLQ